MTSKTRTPASLFCVAASTREIAEADIVIVRGHVRKSRRHPLDASLIISGGRVESIDLPEEEEESP